MELGACRGWTSAAQHWQRAGPNPRPAGRGCTVKDLVRLSATAAPSGGIGWSGSPRVRDTKSSAPKDGSDSQGVYFKSLFAAVENQQCAENASFAHWGDLLALVLQLSWPIVLRAYLVLDMPRVK